MNMVNPIDIAADNLPFACIPGCMFEFHGHSVKGSAIKGYVGGLVVTNRREGQLPRHVNDVAHLFLVKADGTFDSFRGAGDVAKSLFPLYTGHLL